MKHFDNSPLTRMERFCLSRWYWVLLVLWGIIAVCSWLEVIR